MRWLWMLQRKRAATALWWAGWFNSPKQTRRREEYWSRLERTYIALNKAKNSAIPE
jgi:hypothetical protein